MSYDNKNFDYKDSKNEVPEKNLDQIKRLVRATYNNLEKINNLIEKIEQDEKKEIYKALPGVEGVFDGQFLISDDGIKKEVPANYAAKSRLIFGDRLKLLEEEGGKQVFKQIDKLERQEIEGLLSKKEGRWYLLANEGTYKISDTAAEFNQAQLNEKAVALIPQGKPNVPFAALDKIIRPNAVEEKSRGESLSKPVKEEKKETKLVEKEVLPPVKEEKSIEVMEKKPLAIKTAPEVQARVSAPVRPKATVSEAPRVTRPAPSRPAPATSIERREAPQMAAPKPQPAPEYTPTIALDDDDLR